MNILQLREIKKSYGVEIILRGVSFHLQEGEKVGIVGSNGAGKTTLMNILTGSEDSDSGEIILAKGTRIGYLQQQAGFDPENSLEQELRTVFLHLDEIWQEMHLLEHRMAEPEIHNDAEKFAEVCNQYELLKHEYEVGEGFSIESKIRMVASGLGFASEELQQPMGSFSGGQKTRARIAKLLLDPPDIMVLDEPTNHLDMNACEWLEGFLSSCSCAVAVVSHDRYFLDRFAQRIVEIADGIARSYPGNYSKYLQLKEQENAAASKQYAKSIEKIRKLEEYIRRNKAGVNAKQARGRQSMLDRMDIPLQPGKDAKTNFQFAKSARTGEVVFRIEDAVFAWGDKKLIDKLNLIVRSGERIGIVGPNGAGKSTLLKLLLKEIWPKQGRIETGRNVHVGYLDQLHSMLRENSTPIDEIMSDTHITEEEARSLLARFSFGSEDIKKPISALSGGEKARILLAKILLREPNVLLLDEPTNHLDIAGREALEDALDDYEGTIIIVSHDRYFLDKSVAMILEVENGQTKMYQGDYTYYREKKAEEALALQEVQPNLSAVRKQAAHARRSAGPKKKKVDVAEILNQIDDMEKQLLEIAQQLSDEKTYANPEQVVELNALYAKTQEDIAILYNQWEEAGS